MRRLKNNIVKALERILQVPFVVSQKSTRIYAMGYNPKKMELYIVFNRDFEIYKYTCVPEDSWKTLKSCESQNKSLGKSFQELVIKPQYSYVRCELSSSSHNNEK